MRCVICDAEIQPHEVKIHRITKEIEPCITCRLVISETIHEYEVDSPYETGEEPYPLFSDSDNYNE